jgi:ribonuclease HI
VTINIPSLLKDIASTAHVQLVHDLHCHTSNIIIYMDGSQLDSHTEAGYYIPNCLPWEVRTVIPMGTSSEVFDAKLRAIDESLKTYLKYIRHHYLRDRAIYLFTNNQSAIQQVSCLSTGLGQELARSIHTTSTCLCHLTVPVILHWVPGHTDISGNNEADHITKPATTLPPMTTLPVSLSWLCCKVHNKYIMEWTSWYDAIPKPKTYAAPHKCKLDTVYTTLP